MRHRTLLRLALAFASAPLAAACGGSSNDNGAPADASAANADAASDASSASDADASDAHVSPSGVGGFAVKTVYYGDIDRNGTPSTSAWKQFGRNIDGLVTTKDSTDVCTQAPGASKTQQFDGDNGIDNSFGANILPIWLSIAGNDFAKSMNAAIVRGALSAPMFALQGLGSAADAPSMPAAFFGSGRVSAPPLWDGNDVRTIFATFVENQDPTRPKLSFPNGAMVQRVWTGGPSSGPVAIPFLDVSVWGGEVDASSVVVSMTVAADGRSVTGGTISGVVPTEALVAALYKARGRISTGLCSSAAFDAVATEYRQASDILSDGTNAAGKACDAISFGFGFDATKVVIGEVMPPPPPLNDPCGASGDAGVDADADAQADGGP